MNLNQTNIYICYSEFNRNKKVLLRERKRLTARCAANARSAVLSGGYHNL